MVYLRSLVISRNLQFRSYIRKSLKSSWDSADSSLLCVAKVSTMKLPLLRFAAVTACFSLLTSTCLTGTYDVVSELVEAVQSYREYPGHYSQRPLPAYKGDNPGRGGFTRGGLWSEKAKAAAKASGYEASELMASEGGEAPPPLHTLHVAPQPGAPLPWEGEFKHELTVMPPFGRPDAGSVSGGGSPGNSVDVPDGTTRSVSNTANGNRLTSVNLFRFGVRGGMTLDFTLNHNSQYGYNDELGVGWTWTYDLYINENSGVATVHWGDGLAIPYTWNGTSWDAPAGIFDTLVKNGGGDWTLTKKNQTVYEYNSAGFVTDIVDRNGNAISFTYNAYNYVTKITDPTGREVNITLDGNNNFTSVEAPDGKIWSFTLDGNDNLTEIIWPTNGSTYKDIFGYNANDDITTHTDRRGKNWTYTYNVDQSIATETNPLGKTWSYSYTSGKTTITDPLSKTVEHNYSSGMLASMEDESGFTINQTLNGDKLPTSVVDQRGKTWSATYDSRGNLLTETNPLSKVWEYTYDSDNVMLTAEDPLGNTTTYTPDANGNIELVEDALGRDSAAITYNAYGQPTSIEDALTKVTTVTYDANGYTETITDPNSNDVTLDWDSMGRLVSQTDALSYVTSFAYDNWGRLTTKTMPGSATRSLTYHPTGQVVTSTNERSKVTNYTYNDAGRLTNVTNARSDSESYAYNDRGDLLTVTNGNGKVRTYTYTDRGEVATLTMPDSAVEAWTYDGNGNTTAYTNPLSQVIYYTFDNASRQTGVDYPTGTDTTFAYDDANRRTSMVDGTGTTGWTYNAASEATAFSSPQGNLSYTYDLTGRRATMVESIGTTTYTYDDGGRLTSLENANSEVTDFTYDDNNRITRQDFHNGTYQTMAYDSRNRMTDLVIYSSAPAAIQTDEYEYDDTNNLTKRIINGSTTLYGYDDIDQLTSENRSGTVTSYTYDDNGNRLTKAVSGTTETYSYDDGDKLEDVSVGGTAIKTYGYDAAGRTTSVVTSAGTTTLDYDYEGRISQITYPGSSTNTFTYNGLDTRVGKVDSAGTKTYRRDGDYVTAPVLGDGTSAFTPGISERKSSSTRMNHVDYLGSIVRQTGSAGTSQYGARYDAFGATYATSGSSWGPFGFAGQWGYQTDADSGLMLLGHRYYDSSTGRLLTRDPIKDGRNWYAYGDNNPLNEVDEDGLQNTRFKSGPGLLEDLLKRLRRRTQPAPKPTIVKPINRQKQDGHIEGTPQYKNRVKQGKPTSKWAEDVDPDELTREALAKGKPAKGNPGTVIHDFGRTIGYDQRGKPQSRVKVHVGESTIHGHPVY